MPLRRFRDAMARRLDETKGAAQENIPAQNVRNQLPGSALPPGGPAGAGYSPSAHDHAAGDIVSGTMATARLGSGTADSTTFLRGDQTWATPTATPTSHATTHQHGGGDEVATATPAANAIPKAEAGGQLASGWLPTDLTDGGDSTLHYHASDRNRANHTGTQTSATISDLQEFIDDRMTGLLVPGNGIVLTYNDPLNTLTIDALIDLATDVTGVLPVAQGGSGVSARPAFSAWLTSGTNQTIATATFTKVQANNETEDTNSNYDPNTNFRFTPTVAGTYLFIANGVYLSPLVDQKLHGLYLYKNGVRSQSVESNIITSGTGDSARIVMVGKIAANGSSDYFELYTYHEKGSNAVLWAGAGSFSAIWVGP